MLTQVFLLSLPALIAAHGMLLTPSPRILPGMDNKDYLRNPLPRTFTGANANTMYTCGGIDKPASPTYTTVTPGQNLALTWEMGLWTGAALHQGLVEVSISQNGDNGPFKQLKTLSLIGDATVDATPHGMSVTLPSDLVCATVGGCTLQWRWNASVTPERFINCADLMTSKTAAGSVTVSSLTSAAASVSSSSTISTAATATNVIASSTAIVTKTAKKNRMYVTETAAKCTRKSSTVTVVVTPTSASTAAAVVTIPVTSTSKVFSTTPEVVSSTPEVVSSTPEATSTSATVSTSISTAAATVSVGTTTSSSATCAVPTTVTAPARTVTLSAQTVTSTLAAQTVTRTLAAQTVTKTIPARTVTSTLPTSTKANY